MLTREAELRTQVEIFVSCHSWLFIWLSGMAVSWGVSLALLSDEQRVDITVSHANTLDRQALLVAHCD